MPYVDSGITRGDSCRHHEAQPNDTMDVIRRSRPAPRRIEASPPDEEPALPTDRLENLVIDLGKSGLETFLWRAVELSSLHIGPLGPPIVRCLYLGAQLLDTLIGLNKGEGVIFTVAIPGLGDVLPQYFELDFTMQIAGERHGLITAPAVSAQIQVFQPWFPNYDLEQAEEVSPPGRIPPAQTPEIARRDQWGTLLALLGPELIRNLSVALAKGAGVHWTVLNQELHAEATRINTSLSGIHPPLEHEHVEEDGGDRRTRNLRTMPFTFGRDSEPKPPRTVEGC